MAGLDMADLTDNQIMHNLYDALDAKDVDQFQILVDEAQRDDEKIVKILLEAKIDVNEISLKNPIPALILAVEKGNVEILKLLLEDPAIKLDISEPKYGKTALHTVINEMRWKSEDNIIIFDSCLDVLLDSSHTINVNVKDKKGETPLHIAASYGLDGAIVKLLNKGADPYLKNIDQKTSFYSLFRILFRTSSNEGVDRYIKRVELMLKSHNPNSTASNQPLDSHSSILHELFSCAPKLREINEMRVKNFIQCLDLIIELPYININIQNENGKTPLHRAAMLDFAEAVKTLLEKGANPKLITKDKQNILHLIANTWSYSRIDGVEKYDYPVKCLEIILIFYYVGENKNSIIPMINQQDKFEATPLYYACFWDNKEIVKLLIRNGAQLDKRSCQTICPATLESAFDSCIEAPIDYSYNPDSARLVPVTFNYSSLLTTPTKTISQALEISCMPANKRKQDDDLEMNAIEESSIIEVPQQQDDNLSAEPKEDNIIYSESEILWHLSQYSKHRHLLDHPLVKSFLMLKCHSFRKFYWTSVAIYTLFLVLFSTYILLLHSGWDHPILATFLYVLWVSVTLINFAFFFLEILQFATIPVAYVKTYENWIDVPLIALTFGILFHGSEDPNSVKHLSAVAILLAWSEGLILLSKHPILSTNVTMFTKVSKSFLQLFGWFSVLLIGFAFSFFLIFGPTPEMVDEIGSEEKENNATSGEEKRQFINIYDTFLKSFAMMKDEYDFGDLPFGADLKFGVISRLLFVTFMFLVTIVMMNLLNGLAIYDIQDIRKQAEIYCSISQVELFATREFILLGDPSLKLGSWTSINWIFRRYLPITTTKLEKSIGIIKYLYRKAFPFYNNFQKKTSITFSSEGEIVECSYWNKPNPNSSVPKSYQNFKLKSEILQRAQQKARDIKRKAGQRDSMDDTISLKMDTIKSELIDTMKQELEHGIRSIKQQHCNLTCFATNATLWSPNSNYGMVDVSGYVSFGAPVNVNVIKTALLVYGPLVTGIMIGGTFYTYKSGVYKDTNTSTNCMSVIIPAANRIPPKSLNYVNHGPVMVGYGNDAKAGPFWVLRYSWGSGWGELRYMRMAAGINLCNIQSYLMWVNPFF